MNKILIPLLFLVCIFQVKLLAQVDIQPDSSNFQSKVTIDNVFENNGMKYPGADGSKDQFLRTDGNGNLAWQHGANDFNSYFSIVCNNPMSYDLGATPIINDECGTLYDSGGAGGNYSNNEFNGVILSFAGNPNYLYTRIILKSLDIEDNRDTLFIEGFAYFLDLNTPDTLYYDGSGAITIEFKSDGVNTEAGFEMTWDRMEFQAGNSVDDMIGFFFNAKQQSIGGGVELDKAWNNVGKQSVLLGFGGKASNEKTSSFGYKNEASGMQSNAYGYENKASGDNSYASGYQSQASGNNSQAIGYLNIASGQNSLAIGQNNNADTTGSAALGYNNVAGAFASGAFGHDNDALALRSNAIGSFNQASGERSSAFGYGNNSSEDNASAFGYANDAAARSSSAFGALNDAKGIRSLAVGYLNNSDGAYSIAVGYDNTTEMDSTSAFGVSNIATALNSSALGFKNEVSGSRSFAAGIRNIASAGSSVAIGLHNSATEINGIAFGNNNEASGLRSSALGLHTISDVYQMMAIGCYNENPAGSKISWLETDPVFMIGNGEDQLNRSTAVTVLKNGKVGIGTTIPGSTLEVNGDIKSTNDLIANEDVIVNGEVRIGTSESLSDGGANTILTNSSLFPSVFDNNSLGNDVHRWSEVWAVDGTINTSDRRLKSNIKKLDYGLDKILQLQPVSFKWKGKEDQGEKLGLIAQDLLKVLPEVVKTHSWKVTSEEPGAPKQKVKVENLGVYYTDLIPVVIRAIQEQQILIDKKETLISNLNKKVEKMKDLEKRILKLETLINQVNMN